MTSRDREWQDAIDRQAALVLQSAMNMKRIAEGADWMMRFPARMELRRAERQLKSSLEIISGLVAREDARLEAERKVG